MDTPAEFLKDPAAGLCLLLRTLGQKHLRGYTKNVVELTREMALVGITEAMSNFDDRELA